MKIKSRILETVILLTVGILLTAFMIRVMILSNQIRIDNNSLYSFGPLTIEPWKFDPEHMMKMIEKKDTEIKCLSYYDKNYKSIEISPSIENFNKIIKLGRPVRIKFHHRNYTLGVNYVLMKSPDQIIEVRKGTCSKNFCGELSISFDEKNQPVETVKVTGCDHSHWYDFPRHWRGGVVITKLTNGKMLKELGTEDKEIYYLDSKEISKKEAEELKKKYRPKLMCE